MAGKPSNASKLGMELLGLYCSQRVLYKVTSGGDRRMLRILLHRFTCSMHGGKTRLCVCWLRKTPQSTSPDTQSKGTSTFSHLTDMVRNNLHQSGEGKAYECRRQAVSPAVAAALATGGCLLATRCHVTEKRSGEGCRSLPQ